MIYRNLFILAVWIVYSFCICAPRKPSSLSTTLDLTSEMVEHGGQVSQQTHREKERDATSVSVVCVIVRESECTLLGLSRRNYETWSALAVGTCLSRIGLLPWQKPLSSGAVQWQPCHWPSPVKPNSSRCVCDWVCVFVFWVREQLNCPGRPSCIISFVSMMWSTPTQSSVVWPW